MQNDQLPHGLITEVTTRCDRCGAKSPLNEEMLCPMCEEDILIKLNDSKNINN